MAGCCPTCTPSTYNGPTDPFNATATCFQTPVGNVAVPLIRCSPPLPLVVIANRIVEPLDGVRNMFVVVFDPKSKMRVHVVSVVSFTQAEIVSALYPFTMPVG